MAHPIGKRFFKVILSPYVRKKTGLENIPKDRNFIIAANHASYLDHLFISSEFQIQTNKRVHFLAKKEHFDTWFKKRFHEWADAIPVDRQAGGKEALRWAIDALKKGKIIAIHPEGTRTLTGKLQRARTGIARLALNARVPVLPVGLKGTFDVLPKGKLVPRLCFRCIEMNIGNLMNFDEYYKEKEDKKALREVTTKIMEEIAKLCHQQYNFD